MLRRLLFSEFGFRERKLTQLRSWYWRQLFLHMDPTAKIYGRITVYQPQKITVGVHSTMNEGIILHGAGTITIGDHVRIASRTVINTYSLDYLAPRGSRGHTQAPVVIKDGVWICSGAIINPGVTIGEDAVIGPGAIVMRDVPRGGVVAAAPSRIGNMRDRL
ncbi:MAG TPA: acyltransferase [Candidatus Paceibacterota bacterium]|jgi:acetyltransferase-like isoleucine patch superfamily enzyme|nr:acyltransferase [Candidatus Paceibacterota bacterium]